MKRYIFNNKERYKFLNLIARNDTNALLLKELLIDYDINDYHIIKQTANFRFINESDIEKYAGVVLFNKSIYSKIYINLWLDFIKENKIILLFLHKPFPPEYMLEKIKIIDEI